MKAALYARVSTADKDQNPEVQLSKLREYCGEMGWAVYQEYVDQASAADLLRREAWKRLMKDAALHKFDVLLVWRIDRAFRSVIHSANTLRILGVTEWAFGVTWSHPSTPPLPMASLSLTLWRQWLSWRGRR